MQDGRWGKKDKNDKIRVNRVNRGIPHIVIYVKQKKSVLRQLFWWLTQHFKETSELELTALLLNLVLRLFLCSEQGRLEKGYVIKHKLTHST